MTIELPGSGFRGGPDGAAEIGPATGTGPGAERVSNPLLAAAGDGGSVAPSENRELRGGCPLEQVRAGRYAVQRSAQHWGKAVVLPRDRDLVPALQQWLLFLLAYDYKRRDGGLFCWVLWKRNEDCTGLVHAVVNEQLRDPYRFEPARDWATPLLDGGEPFGVQLRQEQAGAGHDPLLPVSEWRAVWCAGMRGYAPLFPDSPACRIAVPDLDPATGAACPCRPTGGQHG